MTDSIGQQPVQLIDNWQPNHSAYRRLLSALQQEVETIYVVGGAVRDYLLGDKKHVADLDVVIDQRAMPIARRLADRLGWAYYAMDEVHDIARLIFTANQTQSLICDISSMRGLSIEDDLLARDFTINAMAIEYRPKESSRLLDLHHGQQDLADGILRRVSPLSLSEDPIRLLRAPRLMAQLNLTLDNTTLSQIQRLADSVQLASPERIQYELWRMMTTRRPKRAIEHLQSLGLLNHALPEVAATAGVEQSPPHVYDVFEHTLNVVEWSSHMRDWLLGVETSLEVRQPELCATLMPHQFRLRRHFSEALSVGRSRADWLVWHALLHDIGKPTTASVESVVAEESDEDNAESPHETELHKRIRFLDHETLSAQLAAKRLEYLRFSRREVSLSTTVLANHMRLHQLHYNFGVDKISSRSVFRFFRSTGGKLQEKLAGVDVVLLSLADYLGTYRTLNPDWPVYLSHAAQLLEEAFSEEQLAPSKITPLVDGHQIMQHLSIPPGERVGELLESILEAQACGEVVTRDEALSLAEHLHESIDAISGN